MLEADPETFFRPAYVGHRGWLGVRLDRDLEWAEVAGIVAAAHRLVQAGGRASNSRARPSARRGA